MKKLGKFDAIKALVIIKNAINYNGTSCDFDISVEGIEKDIIRIHIMPKMDDFWVMFHALDLEQIGNVFNGTLKFITYTKGCFELIYFR